MFIGYIHSGVTHDWFAGAPQLAFGFSWSKPLFLKFTFPSFEAGTQARTHLLPSTVSPDGAVRAEHLSSKIPARRVQSQACLTGRQRMAAYHRVLGNKVYLKTLSEKCVPNKG